MDYKKLWLDNDWKLILSYLNSKAIILDNLLDNLELLLYENKKNDIIKRNLIELFYKIIDKNINNSINYDNIIKIIFYLLNNEVILTEEITNILSKVYEKFYSNNYNMNIDKISSKFEGLISFINNGYFNTQSYSQKIRYNIIKIFLFFLNKIDNFNNEFELIKIILDIVEGEKDPRNILLAFQLWDVIFSKFNLDTITKFKEDIYDTTSCYFPITFNQNNNILNQDDLIKNIVKILIFPIFRESFIELIFEKIMEGDDEILISCFKSLKFVLISINEYQENEKYLFLKPIYEKLKNLIYNKVKIDLIDDVLPTIKYYFSNLLSINECEFIPFINLKNDFLNIIFNEIEKSSSSKNSYISYLILKTIFELNNTNMNNIIIDNFLKIIIESFKKNKESTSIVYIEEFIKLFKDYFNIYNKINLNYFEQFFNILKDNNYNSMLMILMNKIEKNKCYDSELLEFYNMNILNFDKDIKYIKISLDFIVLNYNNKNEIINKINSDLLKKFSQNNDLKLLEMIIYLTNYNLWFFEKIFLIFEYVTDNSNQLSLLKIIYDSIKNSKILEKKNNRIINICEVIKKLFLDNSYCKEIKNQLNRIILVINEKLVNYIDRSELINYLNKNFSNDDIKKLVYLFIKNNVLNFEEDNFNINDNKYECKIIFQLNLKNKNLDSKILNYSDIYNLNYIYSLKSGLINFNNEFYIKLGSLINQYIINNLDFKWILNILYKKGNKNINEYFIYYKRIYLIVDNCLKNMKDKIIEKDYFKFKIINLYLAPFEVIKSSNKAIFNEILNYFINNVIEDEKFNFLKLCNKLINNFPNLFIENIITLIDIFRNYIKDYENIKEYYLFVWNISNLKLNNYNNIYIHWKKELKLGLSNKNRMVRRFNGMIINNFEVNLINN